MAVVIGISVSALADSLRLHAMRERDPDPYAVLRISRAATRADVARAYRALAKQLHPDMAAGDSDAMRKLNWARYVLSDPVRRAAWDAAHFGPPAPHWTPDRRVRSTVRAGRTEESWTGWAEYRDGPLRGAPLGSEPTAASAGLSLGCISLVLVALLLMLFVLLAGLASTGGRDPGSLRTPPAVTSAP
jgi:hypothetical protein